MSEYPVILEGRPSGSLKITRRGAKYLFDAFCPDTDALIRLSVYGDGREGYLGVMQPEDSGMRLQKVLSQRDMARFPSKITHAGAQGGSKLPAKAQYCADDQSPPPESDTLWRSDGLGLLWAEEAGAPLCAVPRRLGIACLGEEIEPREIEGVNYRVFKINTGKKVGQSRNPCDLGFRL